MSTANTIELQRNLAQEQLEQRKERPGLLEKLLGKLLGVPPQEYVHTQEISQTLPQEPGFLAGIGAFLGGLYEKSAEMAAVAGNFFDKTPQQFEVVHIGGDSSALQQNPEFVQHQAAQMQVESSSSTAALGTITPGPTPASPKTSPEAYHGPQLGLSLRATHA